VEADAGRLSVRYSASSTESYDIVPSTKFGYLGPAWQQQKTPAGPARLLPGAEVSVDWVLRNRTRQAQRITIWVSTPE
jgi:hypothetical protein